MAIWLSLAALNGLLAVAAGAFGAHALAGHVDAHGLTVFETAARYHMYHALAIGLAAMAMRGEAAWSAGWAALLFLIGIVIFSGSLYALALTGMRWLGAVTPIGGLAFMAGWVMLIVTGLRLRG